MHAPSKCPPREELASMYTGMRDSDIAKIFHVDTRTVCDWRKKLSIPTLSHKYLHRHTYLSDNKVFDKIDSPDKAYIIGFIYADGNIHPDGKSVSIAISDKDIILLYRIRDCIGSTAPIHKKYSKNGYRDHGSMPQSVLNICSQRVVQSLISLGITPRKSYSLDSAYPPIDPDLDSHFIRGLLDGDGWVTDRQFGIGGTRSLMPKIASRVQLHTGVTLLISKDHPSPNYARMTGCKWATPALIWIYQSAGLKLDRKFQTFMDHWT